MPDQTTFLNFRHLLAEHQIAEQFLESMNQSLSEKEDDVNGGDAPRCDDYQDAKFNQ